MANPERGEVAIVHEGRPYTFVLTLNAMVKLQEQTGVLLQEFMTNLADVKKIRTLFWAAADAHHEDLDEKAIGQVLNSVGGIRKIVALAHTLVALSNPDEADLQDAVGGKAGAADPPTAQDGPVRVGGIGGISSSKRAASA